MRIYQHIIQISIVATVLLSGCASVSRPIGAAVFTRADEVVQFKPPQPERWTMPNGLTVVYLQDRELPLVQGQLMIRGGSLWAERYPLGTTSAMGETMRSGGAGALSADALDRELEKLAAAVSSSFSHEFGSVSFSCLTADLNQVFQIFSDVALRPRFEGERLALWKGQSLEGIRRRVEDPGTVASIAFTQLLYGDSAYGRVSRSKDIASITRADLEALHRELVRPDGAILVVTGSVERDQIKDLIDHQFGSWRARGRRLPPAPPVNYEPKPGIYFVTLPFAQASVKAGHLGVPRLTPDYPAIDLFNELFGSGGFGSRLMKRVRTELGLTYGVYGGIAPAVVKGSNYIFLQTKADSTGAALVESIAELERLQRELPSEQELNEKRLAIENSYVFNFSSVGEIAARLAKQELLGFPDNYDATYLSKIAAVTPADLSQVAKERWDSKKLVVVVVGNESAYAALEREHAKPESRLNSFKLHKVNFSEALDFKGSVDN
jgi:zinc protease